MSFLSEDDTKLATDDENILKILFQIILRNKKLIIILFLSIVVSLYAVIVNLTYQFESSSQLIVKLGRENVRTPLTVENASVYSNGVKKEDINSYISLLTSDSLINKTIKKIGYERFKFEKKPETIWQHIKFTIKSVVRFAKSQVNSLLVISGLKLKLTKDQKIDAYVKKMLNVVLLSESNVIRVSIRFPDPVLARDFVNTHIEGYYNEHIKVNQSENIYQAFKEQTEFYEEQLKLKQNEMEVIKQKWNIISAKEQRVKIMGDMQVVRMKIEEQLSQVKKLTAETDELLVLEKITPQRYKLQEDFSLNPSASLIKEELVRLRLKRSKNSKLYSKNSKSAKLINQQIEKLEKLHASEKSMVSSAVSYQPNPLSENINKRIKFIEVDIKGLMASITQDNKYLKELESDIDTLNKGSIVLSSKLLEYSIIEKKYLSSASRFEQIKIDNKFDRNKVSNVSTLSPATLEVKPVKPKKLLLFVIGLINQLCTF